MRIWKECRRGLSALVIATDRLLWAVRVRWLVVVGFFGLAASAHLAGGLASLRPCAAAAAAGVVLNGINHVCVRKGRWIIAVTLAAMPLDHALITYVVVNTGGVISPFIMMYFVQVVATAMLVSTGMAVASACLAVIAWSIGLGVAGGGAEALGVASDVAVLRSSWAAFLVYCLGLLVYLGGYIGRRLRHSEEDLAEKNLRLTDAFASMQAAYDRLKQAESRLVHSEKMRSLGQLVAGVAHELNNPISFISANVDHLRTYVERLEKALVAYGAVQLPPEASERIAALHAELGLARVLAELPALLDDCEEGARRSKEIVAELRTFSRSDESPRWQTTDLRRGLDTTVGLLAHRLNEKVAIHRAYIADAEVECLPGQINQVFMNILANAIDAIGAQSGNIWINLAAIQETEIQVSICDDGAGMTPEVAARIFEPFFTTKDLGQGTGLGLAVSYGIVQRHHGRITVESTPGVRTTFCVTLPRKQPAGADAMRGSDYVVDSEVARG